jgi:hypothetical protein
LAVLASMIPVMACIGLAAEPDKRDKQRPRPTRFASVFSFGYAGDSMPKEDDRFEKFVEKVKEAGFNTIHCTYTDKRLELCKKHGVQIMIDLLAPDHHVYKNTDKAKALCEKLRGNADVWGYNIWNDPFGKAGRGRRRDIQNVRAWDPTHPAFCGTYRTSGLKYLAEADVPGYYDFHWKRGIDKHFPHLLAFTNLTRQRDGGFYAWLSVTSGRAGKGNFNRNLYSANTSIACGLKGILWFLGSGMMDAKSQKWTAAGQDVLKVNREIMPLGPEIMKLGSPTAVYSTPLTRTANNKLVADNKPILPPGLGKNAFSKEFWIQPAGGEFLLGLFTDADKRTVCFLANHNAYAEQAVVLKLGRKVRVSRFNANKAEWEPVKVADGAVSLRLAEASGALLRFEE